MSDLSVDSIDNFKSSLPPRKRAKTKEEKEQRRVERILRNRRAAHASREKKRKHVEYLELYVLQLEENLAALAGNFDSVSALLSAEQRGLVSLTPLKDVSDLKEQIHANLNSSVGVSGVKNDDDDDLEDDDESPKRRKLSHSESPCEPELAKEPVFVKKEPHDDSELLSVANNDVFFNYLSPISINSPINSPIDLTLKKSEDDLPHLSLDDTDDSINKGYDLMGQNSEVILLSKGYEHEPSSIASY